ncbi:MAG: hypothetical protein AAB527_00875 [Patescibacteria group bacterium]
MPYQDDFNLYAQEDEDKDKEDIDGEVKLPTDAEDLEEDGETE